jgi:formamidopyrimidine-DNA glycosylase
MVEGHSVHRVASLHRQRLVGKKFTASSPNGRFTDGANAINGKTFSRIEAVGKNLFAFFGGDGTKVQDDEIVVHVHFGMAGAWAVYLSDETPPEPTKTNRLRLECPGIVADLSAMTVQHGGLELYQEKKAKLGEDPLRKDADPEALWARVNKSKKSIGALIMDQTFFAGPGNIYRAEILFKAGVHPDKRGLELERPEFDRIWYHTVALLERGYETGSILTVDPEEALSLGEPKLRRYIYNSSKCPRCKSPIKTWQIANRTCYACLKCQPMGPEATIVTPSKNHEPFNSHCARESAEIRLAETGLPGSR